MPLLLGVLFLVMLLLSLAPGDVARLVTGPRAPQAEVDQVAHQLGLDQPIWERYVHYVGQVLDGDSGPRSRPGSRARRRSGDQICR